VFYSKISINFTGNIALLIVYSNGNNKCTLKTRPERGNREVILKYIYKNNFLPQLKIKK